MSRAGTARALQLGGGGGGGGGGGLTTVKQLMVAAEVDGEHTVHEHPYVVIAAEGEHLAARVRELGAQLGREVEVV